MRQTVCAFLLLCGASSTLLAQSVDSVTGDVTLSLTAPSAMKPAAFAPRAAPRDSTARLQRWGHDTLVGAGIGAAIGFIFAEVSVHQSHYSDHSEDGEGIVAVTAIGAFLGEIVGSIVGLVRGP